ncbi:tumor necrosis factor receptor superfamily member 16 [Takifugu flavidus]|uniref:tumor necrosis factor receptor superfamily member 16 n=1 Tax=Takifugu flavidus TaxID=433684 RepID=UPI002544C5AD|nr:tumor necrosis factor receptor superfamily member 16 [Takifugu flavidus]
MKTSPLPILCALVALVLTSKTERAVELPCESGQYTSGGECCLQCPPGEGVVKKCGATQTECSQCLDSETFSENYSHTEGCSPCTLCTGLMRMETPCTDSNDAVCICDYNYFLDSISGLCEPCTVCPAGQGVDLHCEYDHDTVCEECLDNTYSDRESSLDPCLPCTICDEETETELAKCTPSSDSVCHNPLLPTYVIPTTDMDLSPPSFTNFFIPDTTECPLPNGGETTLSSSPHYLILIAVCCSILAAVVVGVVAYLVFKRWNSCKQNKQAANIRAATSNQMVTPEGEKLHSDSGISVDTQSMEEQQQQHQQARAEVQALHPQPHGQDQIVVRVDGGPPPNTPPHDV